MTPYKRQRLILISLSLMSIGMALIFFLYFFRSNLVYFYSPSELPAQLKHQQIIRIGGLVEKNSLHNTTDSFGYSFWICDNRARVQIRHQGQLPDLFRAGQGIVAEGYLNTDGVFYARQILAKHDENYRPPALQRSLDQSDKQSISRSLQP